MGVEEAPWGYEIVLRDPDTDRFRIVMAKRASKACDESILPAYRVGLMSLDTCTVEISPLN